MTEQNTQPDPQDIESAVTTAAPDTGELFARAIFASFFHQPLVGISHVQGGPATPHWGPSPISQVATELWARHGEHVKSQVAGRIDVDEIVERIAERMYQRLVEDSERNDRFSHRDLANSFLDVQRIAREKLAEKLSERQMAAYDAEQAEMRAAWQREQERMRAAPAELESSEHGDESSSSSSSSS